MRCQPRFAEDSPPCPSASARCWRVPSRAYFFASRWLLAPFYLGIALGIVMSIRVGQEGMTPANDRELFWYVVIHVVFVISSVLLALSDRISEGGTQVKSMAP